MKNEKKKFWGVEYPFKLFFDELRDGQKDLGFHQKHPNLCSKYEQRFYYFGTTCG